MSLEVFFVLDMVIVDIVGIVVVDDGSTGDLGGKSRAESAISIDEILAFFQEGLFVWVGCSAFHPFRGDLSTGGGFSVGGEELSEVGSTGWACESGDGEQFRDGSTIIEEFVC